ncbi:HAD-like domain-containing protein [Scheffersomyces coipomensis]|uniref:HAD-like domain-containing protein n=1 Tax=Scheffersomyces coipomensis TaxID=1788519 RepID=UPI00315D82F3
MISIVRSPLIKSSIRSLYNPIVSKSSSSSTSYARQFSSSQLHLNNNLAFVFDIDGVLIRGEQAIPNAKSALDLLNQHKVPFILLTNGGGVPEADRVEFISSVLDFQISPLQIVQSHTPMKALAHKHAYDRVLVVGGPGDSARHCALGYGFQDVVMPIDLVRANPAISPHHRYTQEEFDLYSLDPNQTHLDKPIEAILVFNDPRDMTTDIQIVSDLLNSNHGIIGTKRKIENLKHREDPSIPIIFSNNDFLWANDYNLPRFGQGAFRIIVEELYKHTNQLKPSQHLHSIVMGKPFKIQYDYAHHVLIDWRQKLLADEVNSTEQILPNLGESPRSSPFDKIYMIGDNPESDIKGGNENGLETALVRTGVFRDEEYDSIVAKPTVGVFDDVYESVTTILEKHEVI